MGSARKRAACPVGRSPGLRRVHDEPAAGLRGGVLPLTRLSGVFTVFFNLALNRSTESFEPRVLGGIVLSVTGAVLLVA